jgi:rubrerythrin
MSVAQRAVALARGPLHAVRGTSEPEKMLKNAKTEYSEEAEEIATYTAIEELANKVNDKETAKLAKEIRREEERMASFLQRMIPQLVSRSHKGDPGSASPQRRPHDPPAHGYAALKFGQQPEVAEHHELARDDQPEHEPPEEQRPHEGDRRDQDHAP